MSSTSHAPGSMHRFAIHKPRSAAAMYGSSFSCTSIPYEARIITVPTWLPKYQHPSSHYKVTSSSLSDVFPEILRSLQQIVQQLMRGNHLDGSVTPYGLRTERLLEELPGFSPIMSVLHASCAPVEADTKQGLLRHGSVKETRSLLTAHLS